MFTIKSFSFSPISENTYVLHNEQGDCIIVDPGCYFGNERRALEEYVNNGQLRPKYLLNTHCHLDHVFGNKFVSETWQLQPHIHPNEQPVQEYAAAAGLQWGLPFDNYKGPVSFLREGELIRLGDDRLKILFAPGHSPGHVCFYCEAQDFVLGGDVLFKQGVGRVDLPGGDGPTLIKSIRDVLFALPGHTVVYPGHGPVTTIGYEKVHNPYVKLEGPTVGL